MTQGRCRATSGSEPVAGQDEYQEDDAEGAQPARQHTERSEQSRPFQVEWPSRSPGFRLRARTPEAQVDEGVGQEEDRKQQLQQEGSLSSIGQEGGTKVRMDVGTPRSGATDSVSGERRPREASPPAHIERAVRAWSRTAPTVRIAHPCGREALTGLDLRLLRVSEGGLHAPAVNAPRSPVRGIVGHGGLPTREATRTSVLGPGRRSQRAPSRAPSCERMTAGRRARRDLPR